jgi:hypothetical protein
MPDEINSKVWLNASGGSGVGLAASRQAVWLCGVLL